MSNYTLNQDLVEKYNHRFVFFYGGYLSNWAATPFTAFGKSGAVKNEVSPLFNAVNQFNCSEQYMMLQKALRFSDFDIASQVLSSGSPSEQKALGRKVRGFESDAWDQISRAVVYEGCYFKFTQNLEAMDYLISTDGNLLVEASPYDGIWGIKRGMGSPRIHDFCTWDGANWLGEVLTLLRENLLDSYSYQNPYL